MRRRTAPVSTTTTLAMLTTLVTSAMWAVTAGPPVKAAPSLSTFTTTSAGSLTMTVPQAVDFGGMAPGTEISWQLGTVMVRDTRAPGAGVWTATVSSTDFVRAGTPAVVISRANLTYWSGPATFTQGGGVFVPGQPTAADQVDLSVPRVAFSRTTTTAVNEADWVPTLRLRVPFDTSVRPGVYTGTLTHSVG